MITYRPLRNLLDRRGLSINALRKEVGFSTNVSTALAHDKSVKLDILADIARHLDVPLSDIIEINADESV